MTVGIVNMVTSVIKYILTKFVMLRAALVRLVTNDIQTLASFEEDADIIRSRNALIHM